ncbi:hypothetical protein G6T41_004714 [Salmonella enterica]|nr:hypothetical protein [Salmonella enterica]
MATPFAASLPPGMFVTKAPFPILIDFSVPEPTVVANTGVEIISAVRKAILNFLIIYLFLIIEFYPGYSGVVVFIKVFFSLRGVIDLFFIWLEFF